MLDRMLGRLLDRMLGRLPAHFTVLLRLAAPSPKKQRVFAPLRG